MVKAGTWGEDAAQLHRFFGWKNIKLHRRALFGIKADNCYLDETTTAGFIKVSQEDAAEHPEYMSQSDIGGGCPKVGPIALKRKLLSAFWYEGKCYEFNMLLVNYEAPTGQKRHNRLWNGGNGKGTIKLFRDGKLIDEIIVKNAGCEYGEYDEV